MIDIRLGYKTVKNYKEMIQWCMKEFEVDSERWRYYDRCKYELVMCFRDESDAVAFKLRWM